MAVSTLLRMTVCPRTTLLLSKTYYSLTAPVWGHFSNGHKSTEDILRRSICFCSRIVPTSQTYQKFRSHRIVMPVFSSTIKQRSPDPHGFAVSGKYSDWLLLSTHFCNCRLLSYSCRKGSSHKDNSINFDGSDKFDTKVDLEEQIKHDRPIKKQTDDPEFKPVLQNFEDESTDVNCATGTEGELKQRMKVTNSTLDNSVVHTDVNKRDRPIGFEYDYQVAEDIEEYDYIDENKLAEQQIRPQKVLPISLERGENGVFDLDELITLLEHLGVENIATFPVPPEANFCDHMVVVSVKSRRHLQAINDELLWVHKRKKSQKDSHLVIEGIHKSDWCALDIGNIVLHIFYGESREYYDIESLWTLGPDLDPKCQQQNIDPYVLSAEDLFWLETGKSDGNATDTTHHDEKVKSASAKVKVSKKSDHGPDKVTDSDAVRSISKPTPVE